MFFMRGGVYCLDEAVQSRSIVLFSTNKINFTHKKYSPISQLIESADIHIASKCTRAITSTGAQKYISLPTHSVPHLSGCPGGSVGNLETI